RGTAPGEQRQGNSARGTAPGEQRQGNSARGTAPGEQRQGNSARGRAPGQGGQGSGRRQAGRRRTAVPGGRPPHGRRTRGPASCRRASAFEPSATAAASDSATWWHASRPNATESGDESETVQAPIACAIASTPEWDVGAGGRPWVSTGSTSACWARMFGWPNP